jgi:hypothetical protein
LRSVELGAQWTKSNGDLTGLESVELQLSQRSIDGAEVTGGAEIVLGKDGLDDCPPPETLPELGFDVVGAGFCSKEDISGEQIAEAGFTITFEEELSSDQVYGYVLSGDGDGGEFDLLQSGWIAKDKDGELIDDEAAISVEFNKQEGSSYRGILNVKEGVKSVELGARWEKSNGDLTGNETVELQLSQRGLDGVEVSSGEEIQLGDEGLKDCPPDETSTPSNPRWVNCNSTVSLPVKSPLLFSQRAPSSTLFTPSFTFNIPR